MIGRVVGKGVVESREPGFESPNVIIPGIVYYQIMITTGGEFKSHGIVIEGVIEYLIIIGILAYLHPISEVIGGVIVAQRIVTRFPQQDAPLVVQNGIVRDSCVGYVIEPNTPERGCGIGDGTAAKDEIRIGIVNNDSI